MNFLFCTNPGAGKNEYMFKEMQTAVNRVTEKPPSGWVGEGGPFGPITSAMQMQNEAHTEKEQVSVVTVHVELCRL